MTVAVTKAYTLGPRKDSLRNCKSPSTSSISHTTTWVILKLCVWKECSGSESHCLTSISVTMNSSQEGQSSFFESCHSAHADAP